MCPFETERLRLDYLTLDDAGFTLELLNEPAYIQYIADKGVRDLEGAEAYLRNGPIAMYAKHGHGLYKVSLKQTGEVLGMCGLIRRDTLDYPDLGYAFLSRHGGNGYASESGAAVLERARSHLKMQRIVAITSPDNAASIHVLQKLGFRFDTELHLPGYEQPSRYYVCDA